MKLQQETTRPIGLTRHTPNRVIVAMWIAFCIMGTAMAQELFEIVDSANQQPREMQDAGVRLQDVERWAFGDREELGLELHRKKWELLITTLAAVCDLSAEQTARLCALADLDIFQIQFAYRQAIQQFAEGDKARNRLGPQQLNDLWRAIVPISQRIKPPLGYGNVFVNKYLETILDLEQWNRYKRWESQLLKRKYENYVYIWVAQFEEIVPLTSAQRDKVVAKLLECDPPQVLRASYGAPIVLHVLRSVDGSQMEEWFNPLQRDVIQKLIDSNGPRLRSMQIFLPRVKAAEKSGEAGPSGESQ